MEKKFKLGVIGCGFMASAIIKGILKAKVLNSEDIIVSNKEGFGFETVDGTGVGAHIGVGMAPSQNTSACIQCGQCTLVCPTGALSERDENDAVLDYIANPEITTVFPVTLYVRFVPFNAASSTSPTVALRKSKVIPFTPATACALKKVW